MCESKFPWDPYQELVSVNRNGMNGLWKCVSEIPEINPRNTPGMTVLY